MAAPLRRSAGCPYLFERTRGEHEQRAGHLDALAELRPNRVHQPLTKNWTFRLAEEGFWLATANDNAYNGAGSILAAARPGTSRHLADELDFVNEVKIYRGLDAGFGYARIFTRAFLNSTTGGKDYSYPYAFVEYNFDDRSGGH
jgi:hypothetical protein